MASKPEVSPKPRKKRRIPRNSPGRPTAADLAQRKIRILDVAAAYFIDKGFAETSLVDIAKAAGVATRTIYQHYGDKEDIFRAVIDSRISEIEYEFPDLDCDHSLFDVLVASAHYVVAVALSDAAIPIQRLMIAESNRFPDLMHQIFDSTHLHFHTHVEATFKQLAAAGRIPADDHTKTSKYFIDLLLGTAPLQLTMGWIDSGPSEAEIRDKVSLFIVGRFGLEFEAGSGKRSGTKNKKPRKKPARRKTAAQRVSSSR